MNIRYEALVMVGIAGMKNFKAVKCLHSHYAHYLCRPEDGNIIGEWVHKLLVDQSESSNHSVEDAKT
jgi:hypothetical protein